MTLGFRLHRARVPIFRFSYGPCRCLQYLFQNFSLVSLLDKELYQVLLPNNCPYLPVLYIDNMELVTHLFSDPPRIRRLSLCTL